MEFSNISKSLQLFTVQGFLNPNITFLGEKMWHVAWNQKITSVIKGKNRKMPIISVKTKISKKCVIFPMFQGSPNPKRFLAQKMRPVARSQTDRHSHRQTDTHFQGFMFFFLQPIIKDRPNMYNLIYRFYLICTRIKMVLSGFEKLI